MQCAMQCRCHLISLYAALPSSSPICRELACPEHPSAHLPHVSTRYALTTLPPTCAPEHLAHWQCHAPNWMINQINKRCLPNAMFVATSATLIGLAAKTTGKTMQSSTTKQVLKSQLLKNVLHESASRNEIGRQKPSWVRCFVAHISTLTCPHRLMGL